MERAQEIERLTFNAGLPILAAARDDLEQDPKPTGTDDPLGIVDDNSNRIGEVLESDADTPDIGGYNWLSPAN